MSSPSAFDAFADRLADWTATDVAFENDDYRVPGTPAAFVYVEIFGDSYNQETIGAPQENMFLEQGVTYLHVMAPKGTGSKESRVHANNLMNLFREQDIDGVKIEEASIGAGEPGTEFKNYWAMTVTLNWYRRDITDLTP